MSFSLLCIRLFQYLSSSPTNKFGSSIFKTTIENNESYQYDILLKCSVKSVKFGERSSHCSCAQIKTSGISIL